MDFITKKLVDKAAAYNQAAQDLMNEYEVSAEDDIEYQEFVEADGTKSVRAYVENVGFSSKYRFE